MRPIEQNGLGMPLSDVAAQFELLKRFFTVLPETGDIFPAWERLVVQYQVVGKPAHDARLVAAIQVHGWAAILTFDKTGFSRYAGQNRIKGFGRRSLQYPSYGQT